jgi:hypothetical protein
VGAEGRARSTRGTLENVSAFLRAARQLGVPEAALFSKGDLDAPDDEARPAVLDCMVALQSAAEARDAAASVAAAAAAAGVAGAKPPQPPAPLSVQLPASLRRLTVSDSYGAASPLFGGGGGNSGAARTPAASTPLAGTPAARGESRESLFSLGINLLRDAQATPPTALSARARHDAHTHTRQTPPLHRTQHSSPHRIPPPL